MSGQVFTLASKELRTNMRDRVFLTILGLFILLSIVSVYIGSSTKNAEMKAYQDILSMLQAQGAQQFPAPPVIHPLSILHNLIDYISMLGAVAAIFLGFDAFSGERKQGTLRLIAVRPVFRDQIVTGKLLGGALILSLVLVLILGFNLLLFILVSGLLPNANEIARLLMFFILAFFYLMLFYSASLLVSIQVKEGGFGFLLMMIAWITGSFVLPQLAASQKNYAYAVTAASATVAQVPTETAVSRAINLFSPAAQFKLIGDDLLQMVDQTATDSVFGILHSQLVALAILLVPIVILVLLAYRFVQQETVL